MAKHHQHFVDYAVSCLGDDLGANQPLCQLIAETYNKFSLLLSQTTCAAMRLAHKAKLETCQV